MTSLSRTDRTAVQRGVSNVVALAAAHGANTLLPVIAFPHVLRVAGPEAYSSMAISEALALIVLAICLYSFEIDGVALVAGLDPRADAVRISRTFTSILCARLILFVVASGLAVLLVLIVAPHLVVLLAAWLLLTLGQVLQSGWLFNGIERNGPLAVAVVASRILALGGILVIVHDAADVIAVPLLIGGSAVLSGFSLMLYLRRAWGIKLSRPETSSMLDLLRSGRPVFLGNSAVLLYRDANVIILGVVGAGPSAIAIYSVAEKMAKGIQALARPVNLALFPVALRRLGSNRRPSPESFFALAKLTLPQVAAIALLIGLAGAGWAVGQDWLRDALNIEGLGEIVLLIGVMAPATMFGIANFMFGSVGLNHLGERRYLLSAIAATGAASVVYSLVASAAAGAAGAASAFLLSELLLLVLIARRYFSNSQLKGHRR